MCLIPKLNIYDFNGGAVYSSGSENLDYPPGKTVIVERVISGTAILD